ncbi:MAG: UvrD-helicase domain-containing protein [Burkholderiaceae bacterium]
MADLLERLNPEQRAAVTLPAQSALILAGAGSGKTRVLTTRIAWLVSTGQVSPQGILAVTFTNKAAKEMLGRLSAMLPVNVRGMWIGTFHGLCNRLLRAHHRDAGLPATFQILDSQDQLSAVKRLLKILNWDDEKFPPRQLQSFINGAKEQGLRAADIDDSDGYNKKFIEFYQAYDDQCQREGVVDFGELLLRAVELLKRNTALRDHYRMRFRHILIDEFQDTNPLQYAWIKELSGEASAVFAVGDDDQSIYAFRGADVANMQHFEREFRVPNLIKLEQNYRSGGHILDAANAMIRNNAQRLGKNLWTEAGEGEQLRILEAASDSLEAYWLIDEIRDLIGQGFSRSEIAILYRSNAQSRVIEHTLFNAGIAYRVFGGLRFFERAEIKHALAYLRLMENPHDDTSFLRVVNFPARGIGARSIEALQDRATQQGFSLYAAVPHLDGKAGTLLGGFTRMIESMRFEGQNLKLDELVGLVIEKSGLIAHYQSEKEGRDRVENLQELINAAAVFISEEGESITEDGEIKMPPLVGFLTHASLEAGDNQAQEGQDAVQLMTVHSAKGLEFNAVFITGLEEGLFPHENSIAEANGLEEERRLMYVAITRARQRLYLSLAQTRMLHGQTRYNMRSRFLDELPEANVRWLTPRLNPAGVVGGGFMNYEGGSAYGRSGGAGRNASSRSQSASPGRAAWGGKSGNGSHGTGAAGAGGRAAQIVAHDSGLKIGQAVSHARFGQGVVTGLEGSGDDARAQIHFKRDGVKWLALSVAKLDPV